MLRHIFCRRAAVASAFVAVDCAERNDAREQTTTAAREPPPVADSVPDLPVEERVAELAAEYPEPVSDAPPELAVTLLDSTSGPFGTYYDFADWARAYADGELSAVEYGEMVAGTVETEAAIAIAPARRPLRSNT
ncbi:hypothetical protein [Halostella sp. PRR32]|uniref:hypothetical protein n=1 Tax=Halostella sp. PRR32 TaxID=3098147 RepID=UPI002B1D3362|nr:hypothetical protein [Halostella sp. PRR32]